MRTKLAIALLLLCSTTAFAADRRIHRSLDLTASGRLSLSSHNGTITITTWNRPTVDIDARIEDVGNADDVNAVQVEIEGGGNSVRVETNYDRIPERYSWFGIDRELPPVHYTISVPATSALEITDHNADVRITGMQGDVRVSAHNGSVELVDQGGAANIDAHNATIRAAFTRFDRNSSFETHNGEITLRLPSAARFNVNASGHHLDFESDFPVTAHRFARDEYVGGVNGGGPELRISTHNGGVRLRRS